MDEQTKNDPKSCNCQGSCGRGNCCHHGKFKVLRVVIGLVVAIIIFALGFGLGRISGFSRFRGGMRPMFQRGGAQMMRVPVYNQTPGQMMRLPQTPNATTTPSK